MLRVPLLLLAPLLAACDVPDERLPLSRAIHDARVNDTDAPWPLTVDSGYVYCEGGRLAVFETEDGRKYAVAGSEATVARSSYPPIEDLQADDPRSESGERLPLGNVVSQAVKHCGPESLAR